MAGRESRGRLLAPSFLIVSTALACGQTTEGGELSMNPPPQTGGSSHFGGNGGASGCPETTPLSGSECVGPSQCMYNVEVGPCGQLSASCAEGRWQVRMAGSCNPPMPISCPSNLPEDASSCRPPGFAVYPPSCSYRLSCGEVVARCNVASGEWEVDRCMDGAAGAPSSTLPPGLSTDPITVMCGPSRCESTPVAGGFAHIDPCCVEATEACGRRTGFLAASGASFTEHCQPLGQPGQLDSSCPDFAELRFTYDSSIVQMDPLPGCCRDDGKCGVVVDELTASGGKLLVSQMGLGCVDSSAFFGQPAPDCGAAGAPSSGGAGGAEN